MSHWLISKHFTEEWQRVIIVLTFKTRANHGTCSSQTHHPCFFPSCPCLPLCISNFKIFFMILSLPNSYHTYRHPNLFFNFSWSIVALQYCASFCCIVEWISHSESEVAQSCPTCSNPMDCSLPGSSVHGILQARVLEWGAIAFSRISHRYAHIPLFFGFPNFTVWIICYLCSTYHSTFLISLSCVWKYYDFF